MPKAPIFAITRHRIPIDGEGVTTLVTFSNCPLSCAYCLNPQCMDPQHIRYDLTPEELLDIVKIDNIYFLATGGGVTFGGGEPCLRSEFIKMFKDAASANSDSSMWRITLETSLAVDRKHIERLAPITDQWIIDVKDMHADVYRAYTGNDISLMASNLQWIAEQGLQDRCRIRVPLIPNFNSPQQQDESKHMLEEMGFSNIELFEYVVRT